ncbi:MAG: 5-methyltetrahydropteroyltriglutamate--homocysteine S-methyltransferase [Opitutales bacterium]
MKQLHTHNLGFPRIGAKRELKKATEAYWRGKLSRDELLNTAAELRKTHWQMQRDAGVEGIPSNDFSFYDEMLDLCCMVGAIPERFNHSGDRVDLDTYFLMARGLAPQAQGTTPQEQPPASAPAMEMTKWFDTNYHNLVPELSSKTQFRLTSTKPIDEFQEAKAQGIETRTVLKGPATFLQLSKVKDDANPNFDRWTLLDDLLMVYAEVLRRLEQAGATWVLFDEPILSQDLDQAPLEAMKKAYAFLRSAAPKLKFCLTTYFGPMRDHAARVAELPVDLVHCDATRAPEDVERLAKALRKDQALSVGVVDGRNIWKNNFDASLAILKKAQAAMGDERVWVAPSCSLMHAPMGLRYETQLDAELKSWLAFSEEKLHEVSTLAELAATGKETAALKENRAAMESRRTSTRIHNPEVKQRVQSVGEQDMRRASPYIRRKEVQQARLNLPLFPTTTIGSFPQTKEVRAMRARWKKGELSNEDYNRFLAEETTRVIEFQDNVGLDVLVHGEYERNDMVEYFGEKLDGFTFTENGWVQSYGSRCVKPPIIFGDVSRPEAMTVRWSTFAQSQTKKPVKGMLTGPVTILQWSFVRDDQPRKDTTFQIALAIRDEVVDLESNGLQVIQIDEPAMREGLPLRKTEWRDYLNWAAQAFRLASSGVSDETQIHTHMCYCEFNNFIDSIAALDADVISIEASRSDMELLEAFKEFDYPNAIGPGVWDIHSPRVPSQAEMEDLLGKAARVIPVEQLWVNPDCGLKTRAWPETEASLKNMIAAAQSARKNAREPAMV